MDTVLYQKQNGIAIVSINRPHALNALSIEVLSDMEQILADLEKDKTVGAIIVTGEGRAFAAGADIQEMQCFNPSEARKFARWGAGIFRQIELLEVPTIAAVNGYALGGGCELALSCDMILASSNAKFGQPEVALGIIPGFSGTQRLARRIGYSKAMELILTGEQIAADTAERINLVNRVVEPDELLDEAKKLAQKITKQAPAAVKYAKNAISRGIQVDIDTAISIENELFALCFTTEEQKIRMNDFLNRRKVK